MAQDSPRKAPFMVENLPENFVARPAEYEAMESGIY